MKLVQRFLIAELVWATGIYVPMLAISLLTSGPSDERHVIQWLTRAVGLAALPAGITIAPAIFKDARPWRQLVVILAAAATLGLAVFVLLGIVAPAVGERAFTLGELLRQSRDAAEHWETRNHAAWLFYTTFFAALNVVLFGAIGIQVGAWATHSLPPSLRRPLYWLVGLGLLVSGYAVTDTTYETFVVHTAADASVSSFYTMLIPLSLCAGLALPTLALLRGSEVRRHTD